MGEAVEHFSYDAVGNRLTDARTGTNTWSYNKNNELQGFDNTSFKYNLNGQMTEKTVNGVKTSFFYNLDGRLNEIKDNSDQIVALYEYDPFGRRTKKYLPQTNEKIYFHYSDEGLVAEYDETGQLTQSYGFEPDSYFTTDAVFTYRPDFTEAKGYAYYIKDHLSTPKKLITNTGRKVWEASEDAFGKTVITNNEFRNPLRFAGQYVDQESDLRYNYFRYYDPTLGRYITSDPIGLIGGLNIYGYVGGNPLNFIDPLGLYRNHYGGDLSDDGTISLQDIVDCIKSKGQDPVSCGKLLGPGNSGCNQVFENCFGWGPTYREPIDNTCDVIDSYLNPSKIPRFPAPFSQREPIMQPPVPQKKYKYPQDNYNGNNPFNRPAVKPPYEYPPQ